MFGVGGNILTDGNVPRHSALLFRVSGRPVVH